MGGGNWPVNTTNGRESIYFKMPSILRVLVERYQNHRCLPSFSSAITELLETHPAIVNVAQQVYNEGSTSEAVPSVKDRS